jgi:hypothetical protein
LIPAWNDDKEPRNFLVDSLRLDTRILDTMAARLGARPAWSGRDTYCYERSSLGRSMYLYCFQSRWSLAEIDSVVVERNAWGTDTIGLRKDELFGYYLFDGMPFASRFRNSLNLTRLLHSAYHQHLFPAYGRMDDRFMIPPGQSQRGLWLRGSASAVWASEYAASGNPFAGKSTRLESKQMFYMLDGLFATFGTIMAISAIGSGTMESLPGHLLVLKGIHSAITLGVFLPTISLELGETIRIRNSGYRWPRTLEVD